MLLQAVPWNLYLWLYLCWLSKLHYWPGVFLQTHPLTQLLLIENQFHPENLCLTAPKGPTKEYSIHSERADGLVKLHFYFYSVPATDRVCSFCTGGGLHSLTCPMKRDSWVIVSELLCPLVGRWLNRLSCGLLGLSEPRWEWLLSCLPSPDSLTTIHTWAHLALATHMKAS